MQLTTISAQGEFFVAHHGVLARPCECTRSGIEQRLELRSIAQECCTGRFHAGLSLAQSRQRRFDICLRRDSLLGAALDRCEQPVERSNVVIPLDHLILRSEEHTSELQSLMRISYAVFCLKKKNNDHKTQHEKYKKT